jgi:hypothetical protein
MIGSCSFFVMAFISERKEHDSHKASKHQYNTKYAMNPSDQEAEDV